MLLPLMKLARQIVILGVNTSATPRLVFCLQTKTWLRASWPAKKAEQAGQHLHNMVGHNPCVTLFSGIILLSHGQTCVSELCPHFIEPFHPQAVSDNIGNESVWATLSARKTTKTQLQVQGTREVPKKVLKTMWWLVTSNSLWPVLKCLQYKSREL